MSLKRRAKWQIINKRVRKHLATFEIQDNEYNETEDSFQKEREIRLDNSQTAKETIKTKYILDSDVSEHCQQFDEFDFFDDDSIVENIDNIFDDVNNISDNESCSSVENYLIEDDITEEGYSNNNNAEFLNNISNNSNIFKDRADSNLSNDLAQWAIEFKISHTALNSLVCILKKYNFTLPSNARTLLKTQRKAVVLDMHDGKYCYFGIANNLKIIFSKVPVLQSLQKINLFVNIDGIPLVNSSSIQFWPILCKINQSLYKLGPFIVAVYCGQSKPSNIHDYLKDFIHEYKTLCDVGIIINTKLYSVSIAGFICDAPARAFIKQVKGHTGFYGCEKCTQKGAHPFNATIFNEIDTELRTNENFLLQTQFEHHNGVSTLAEMNFPLVFYRIYIGLNALSIFRNYEKNTFSVSAGK